MKLPVTIATLLFITALLPRQGYGAAGDLDYSFDANAGTLAMDENPLNAVAHLPDGKVLLGGTSSGRTNILRLNADGTRDLSFNAAIAGDGSSITVASILPQPDGKVLIAGSFTNVNGEFRTGLVRLQANGDLDPSFEAREIAHPVCMAQQADGRVLVVGSFEPPVGYHQVRRFRTDGTPDPSFNFDASFSASAISAIAVLPDGKVLVAVGPVFWPVFLRRFNPDGSPDTSFQTNVVVGGSLASIVPQPDGKILISGVFVLENSDSANILRLNTDGSLDTSFHADIGMDGQFAYVKSQSIQPDGKILIAGKFSHVSGISRSGVARLNADGRLDPYFDPGSISGWSAESVSSVLFQPDGRVLIAGDFDSINGVARRRVARLFGDAAFCTAMRTPNGEFVAHFVGTPGLSYTIESTESISRTQWQKRENQIAPTANIGAGIGGFEFREQMLPTEIRIYRAVYPAY